MSKKKTKTVKPENVSIRKDVNSEVINVSTERTITEKHG